MSFAISKYAATAMLVVSAPIIAENITPKVVEIQTISQVLTNQPEKTLFLFDIDDTIFDSSTMLGSKNWRTYIRNATKKIDGSRNWHDILTLELAQKHPLQTVEHETSDFVKELQDKGYVVCGFTSRERQAWYDMPINGVVDRMTVKQLLSVGVDFNNRSLESIYPELSKDSEYFEGTFFCNIEPKGKFLEHLLKDLSKSSIPPKIVFVDDKLSQVESVANSLAELGIQHECYHYIAINEKGKRFDPLIANIQLYHFIKSDGQQVFSDEEARAISQGILGKSAEDYLQETLNIMNERLGAHFN